MSCKNKWADENLKKTKCLRKNIELMLNMQGYFQIIAMAKVTRTRSHSGI